MGDHRMPDLAKRVAALPWWHKIDLGYGVITPGHVDISATVPYLQLPERLNGQTVCDVGAWDGGYSFECEKRGASDVLATDWFCWEGPGWGKKASFELARQALGSRVRDCTVDVLALDPGQLGTFDIVLFLGVLYHMRHPLLALEKVASLTREMLVLETHVDMLHEPRPAMAFYPGAELASDPSNWFGPNPACVVAMLRDVGFTRIEEKPTPASSRRFYHAFR